MLRHFFACVESNNNPVPQFFCFICAELAEALLDYVDTSPATPLADSSNSTSESSAGMKNGRGKGRARSSSSSRDEDDEEFDLPIGTEGSLKGVDRGIFEHTTTGVSDRLDDPCASSDAGSSTGVRGTAPPSKASHTILIYNKIHSMHNPPPSDVIAESETVLPAAEATSITRGGTVVTVDCSTPSSTLVVVNETQGAKVVGNASTSVNESSMDISSGPVHSTEIVAVIPAVASVAPTVSHVPVESAPVVSDAEQEVSAFWDEPVRAAPAAAVSVAVASAVTAPLVPEPSEASAPAPTSPAIAVEVIPGAEAVAAVVEELAVLATMERNAVDATAVAECREEGSSPSIEINDTTTLAVNTLEAISAAESCESAADSDTKVTNIFESE